VLFRFFDDGHFPTKWSLAIIVTAIGSTLVASLLFPKRPSEGPEREAEGD